MKSGTALLFLAQKKLRPAQFLLIGNLGWSAHCAMGDGSTACRCFLQLLGLAHALLLSLALEIQKIGLCFSARPDRERRRSCSCCVVITISLQPSSLGGNGLRHGSKLQVKKVWCATPKSKASSAKGSSCSKRSWCDAATSASSCRPADTPPPSKTASWRPSKTPHQADSWRPDSTPAKTPKSGFSGPDRAGMRTWVCPICDIVRKGVDYAPLAHLRRSHGKGCHPEVPWSFFLTRDFIKVVEASEDLSEAERKWQCPLCPAALPKQAQRPRHKAVAAHREKCHPKVPIKKWIAAMVSKRHKGTKKPETSEPTRARADAFRAKFFKSHQLLKFLLPALVQPNSGVIVNFGV